MNQHVHIAYDPASTVRPSARVRTVAAMLDEHEREIRRMLKDGELEGHGKGARGVRIYLDSVAAYQQRRAIAVPVGRKLPTASKPPRPAPASTAAHRAAMAGLKAKGII